MKGNWPDDKKNSAKTGGAVKADGCKPNQKSKDYGMTIQQSDMQMKVIDRAADCAPLLPIGEAMVGGELEQTINARDLHAFLEVGKDFTTWVKDRITQYDFVDGVDFTIVETLSSPNSGSSKARSQRVKEYYLTLDMAKELSMVERNAKGKQARQYFIQCERMAKSPNSSPMLVASTMNSDQLALLMGEVKRREAVQLERDEAIRTKAFISSSREASVMAKLGHTKRENEALKEQLGVGTKHKSVKGAGLEQFYIDEGGNRRQTANRLKKLALAMGVAGDIIDIEDPNYGTVKAYPVSVIERFKLEVSV